MSDTFYKVVRAIGRPCFWVCSRPVVIGLECVPATGPFILAATHQSPFDVALLIRHNDRLLDFVSITEVFRNPFVGWFYGNMNAFPLERSRPDAATVRVILNRLEAGRAVAMFPEGRICAGEQSVVHTGRIRSGLGRIAQLTGVPIVPCVIVNSGAFARVTSWLPLRHTVYGMHFGEPIPPTGGEPSDLEQAFVDAVKQLHAELTERLRSRERAGQGGDGDSSAASR